MCSCPAAVPAGAQTEQGWPRRGARRVPGARWHLGGAVHGAHWHLASLNLYSPARGSDGSLAYTAQSVKLPSDLGIFPLGWCLSGHSCSRDVLQTPLESIHDPLLHLAGVTEWVRWEGTSPGQLEKFVQGQGELSFQYLHRWRLPHLSGQPGPAFERPGSKKVFPCVGIEFHVFLFMPVASCPVPVPSPLQVTQHSDLSGHRWFQKPKPNVFSIVSKLFLSSIIISESEACETHVPCQLQLSTSDTACISFKITFKSLC